MLDPCGVAVIRKTRYNPEAFMQLDLIISFLFIIAWMPLALFYAHRFQYGDGLQLIDEPVLICLLSMITPRNEFKVEVALM